MSDSTQKAKSKEEILEKLRKLRAMTAENGASENEAKMAAKMVSKLLDEYNLTLDEVDIKKSEFSLDCLRMPCTEAEFNVWTKARNVIAKLTHTRCYYETQFLDILGLGRPMKFIVINYYGTEVDREAALALVQTVYRAIVFEGANYLKEHFTKRQLSRTSEEVNSHKLSFILGLGNRVAERIKELIPPEAALGQGLMVLKDQLVTEGWAKMRVELGLTSIKAKSIPLNHQAYSHGQIAGSRVDLNLHGKVEGGLKPQAPSKRIA